MFDLFTDYTIRNVVLGSALLGVVSGVLGCFAVLRRQGLLGDALAHAALPGICIAFLLTGTRSTPILLVGAAIAAAIGVLALTWITRATRLGEDSGLGIVLSVFFGVGITLLTFIARRGDAAQAGLDRFLFGQAAALVEENVITIGVVGAISIALVVLFFKEFKVLAFDGEFAGALGYNLNVLNGVLLTLILVAIVIGLQTVGAVLMAAMLIGPAAAARQWTNRLSLMVVLAAFIGAAAGVSGSLLSLTASRLPTGPLIILCLTAMVAVSIVFGSARGLVWTRRTAT